MQNGWSEREQIRDELRSARRLILIEELAKEWEDLRFQHQLNLRPPTFQVQTLTSQLANWHPETRCITISSHALETLAWDSVIGILKHEVAHQIVSEIYNSSDQHGAEFQKAADRIGLLQPFRKHALDLDEARESEKRASTLPQDVARKIARIEALAHSSNPHEARVAESILGKMREELDSSATQEGMFRKTVSLGLKRVPHHIALAAGILSEHFHVRVLFSSEFIVRDLERRQCLILFGQRHHVLMAEHVFMFLLRESDRLWKQEVSVRIAERPSQSSSRIKERNDFLSGLMKGFASFLRDQEHRRTHEEPREMDQLPNPHANRLQDHAIQISNQKKRNRDLDAFMHNQYPRISLRSTRRNTASESYERGMDAGRSIRIANPIETSHARGRGKLLASSAK